MDRRIINMALSAVLLGAGVRLREGVTSAALAVPMISGTLHDMSPLAFDWRELWRGVLLIWGLPSALGAFLVACLKPQRWVLYGACACVPGLLMTIQRTVIMVRYDIFSGYFLFLDLVNLALLPLFLWLFYSLI